ncbi:DNA polymerase III subunit beta [Thermosediminibacter oceani]|uniref:Beta sliding clamp n=1 Tax=Thermosediminibacter oceani (strain ATCC BAA-1034 / DSM 16646 / JW/IW-1228P) TaxID=555079 RepID=D9RYX1_THEOJ|nr:DNA polymerase III subunit beta [Thermosediminibacter oceani]ADL06799.1 DNA polymerase III, beta subunit [Thermosediminibacter oceani DSM 16646]
MQFLIEKDQLLSGVSVAERFIASKTTMPILSGIKFSAYGSTLELSSTDLEMGIECRLPAQIMEEGDAVISTKVFSDIARKLPQGQVLFRRQEGQITVEAGDFRLNMPVLEAGDFPEVVPPETNPILKFPKETFKNMVKQTIFARAEDSIARPVLTGELLEARNGRFHVVALDGFRIAWRWEEAEVPDFSVVVPGRALLELTRALSDTGEDTFEIHTGRNRVVFCTENLVMATRVLEGKFIDYEQVVKVDPKITVVAKTDALLSSIERAFIVAREGSKNNLVKFRIGNGRMEVSSETEMGSVYEKVECETSGDDLVVAFNARFFIEALRSVEQPEIELKFAGEVGPCVIRPRNVENHINFILPVRLRSEDY